MYRGNSVLYNTLVLFTNLTKVRDFSYIKCAEARNT